MVQATIGRSGASLASARGPPLGALQRKGRDRGENRPEGTHQIQSPNGAVAFRAFQQLISIVESTELNSADPNIAPALRKAKEALQSESHVSPVPDDDGFMDSNESAPMSTADFAKLQQEFSTLKDKMGTLPEVRDEMDGLFQRFIPRARRPTPYD